MTANPTYADLVFDQDLDDVDPLVADLIAREHRRQRDKLILIPSESLTPAPVRAALGSPLTSIYGEGYPSGPMRRDLPERLADTEGQLARFRRYGDRRYYRGNDYTNLVEALAQRRCAALFANERVPADGLYVNVQALSGAAANNAVYEALLEPDDRILGLALAHGGHLSHGASVNRSGRRFQASSYSIEDVDGKLDYDQIAEIARRDRPRIIVAGYTSYPWAPDWERFRAIADEVGAYLLADISHPAGMAVAGEYPSPVGLADVVTFTTHKTLFGPRGAVILSHRRRLMRRVDRAVFPGEQGGPHLNKVGAMAVAFKVADSPEFRTTQRQIRANAAALAAALEERGVGLAYGGTDTHLLVIDLKRTGASGDLRGEPAVRMLDSIGIVANRNSLPGDVGFAAPTGVRLGTPWLTQRGYTAEDMDLLADILARAFQAMTGVTYPGRRSPRYRGRVDFLTQLQLRGDVAEFAARGRAEEVPAALDPPPSGVLELRGRRVLAFADEIADQRVRDLEPGEALHAGIADPAGDVQPVLFVRPDDDRSPRDRRLFAVLDPSISECAVEWLREIADGYALIDAGEPSRKIVGPIAVADAAHLSPGVTGVVINAADADHLGAEPGVTRLELAGAPVLLARDGRAAVLLYSVADAAAVEADMAARNVARTRLPLAPEPDLSRPFFLGRHGRLPMEPPETRPQFDWSQEASDPLAQVQLRGPVWGALLGGLWREGDPLRQTPLHDVHSNHLGARMVPFAGWSMPVYYGGIAEEHAAVRKAAGLFDVGHMGVFAVEGEHAGEFLDLVTTANASRLPNGRAAYTYLLDPTGHPLDDLIIYRLERERFLAVVNAANTEKNWVWLNGVNERQYEIEPDDPWATTPVQVTLRDLKASEQGDQQRLDLALQGPRSRAVLARLAPDDESRRRLRRMRAFDVRTFTLAGIPMEVAHTGYTGERVGFELLVHPDAANDLWQAILDAGFDDGVRPAGLGSRDSTRTEAGLPLYGHELGGELDLTPGDAGFGGFVKLYKPFFIGRSGFIAREKRRTSQIVRFAITDERVPIAREGDPVVEVRGGWVGIVTSAALDTNQRQVGMAHVMQRVSEEGTPLRVFAGVSARRGGRATVPRELKRGGRYPLPANAVVIPRFR